MQFLLRTIMALDPPTAINDVCILEFDFVAAGDSMSFDYIFASSEYPSDPNNPGGAYVNTHME